MNGSGGKTPAQLVPGPTALAELLPRFSSFSVLGEGGMGAVYQVWDRNRGQHLALKLTVRAPENSELMGDAKQRFYREFELLRRAAVSGRVVGVHDRGSVRVARDRLLLWYTMDLCDESLEDRLANLRPDQRAEVALAVLDGLAFLAAQGIAHRDIKPANVFLEWQAGRPVVRLGDLGIAKGVRPDELHSETLTSADIRLGSPRFMAPEFLLSLSPDPVDLLRADQYAAGMLLYQVFSGGAWPFAYPNTHNTLELFRAKLGEYLPLRVPGLSGSAGPLDATLSRMLAPDPRRRFRDVAEAERSLRSAMLACGLL